MELKQRQVTLSCNGCILLIVPYGIETKIMKSEPEAKKLLIVPYGIETPFSMTRISPAPVPFNRTLWN